MIKTFTCLSLAAIAALMTVSAPAFADGTQPGSQTVVTSAPDAGGELPAVTEKKYCVKEAFSGSRVVQKICKTKQQWMDQGVDITAVR